MHKVIYALLAALGLLNGCAALWPGGPEHIVYDFGIRAPAAPIRLPMTLTVEEVSTPAWLNTSALRYRLGYRDLHQLRAYAESRWVAPPAMLLSLRLRERLAKAGGDATRPGAPGWAPCMLRVRLEEFSQVFATPTSSRAVLNAQAALYAATDGRLIAQEIFHQERPAATPNAQGGAHALMGTADDFADALARWLGEMREYKPQAGHASARLC